MPLPYCEHFKQNEFRLLGHKTNMVQQLKDRNSNCYKRYAKRMRPVTSYFTNKLCKVHETMDTVRK